MAALVTVSSPVHLGLVGLGGHGRTIQSAVEASPDLHVTAVYDPDVDEAAAAAERFACPAVESYDALLATVPLDAVALVTPNTLHRTQAEAAFEAGLDVFVEKPIANAVVDGRAMVEAAARSGRVLMVGHNIRYGRAARTAKSFLDQGRIGDVVSVEIHYSADNVQKGTHEGWRFQPGQCPLLPMMQLGIHAVDLAQYLLGPVREVTARARSVLAPSGIVDNVTGLLVFESEVVGTAISNYCTPDVFQLRLTGTTGIMMVEWIPHRLVVQPRGSRTVDPELYDFSGHEGEDVVLEMQAFADAVRHRSRPETDGPVGLQALAVVEAMEQSARHERATHVAVEG